MKNSDLSVFRGSVDGKQKYCRILIRRKRASVEQALEFFCQSIQDLDEIATEVRDEDKSEIRAMQACHMTAIDALLEQHEQENPKQMTNADILGTMTIEEKAEFLSSISYAGKTPWCDAFEAKFCKSCPTETCTIEGHNHPMELHECDFTGGKCPHGSDIVWWLQQPVEEG